MRERKRRERRGDSSPSSSSKTRALTRSQSGPAEERRAHIHPLTSRRPIDRPASRGPRPAALRNTHRCPGPCAPALRSSSLRLWVASPTPAGPTCYCSWRLSAARRNFPNSSASRRRKRSGFTGVCCGQRCFSTRLSFLLITRSIVVMLNDDAGDREAFAPAVW